MTTRYQKRHYEDVASILHEAKRIEVDIGRLIPAAGYADEFADLFAADNPPRCIDCGAHRGEEADNAECTHHLFADGFDRDQFLAACGLESGE